MVNLVTYKENQIIVKFNIKIKEDVSEYINKCTFISYSHRMSK